MARIISLQDIKSGKISIPDVNLYIPTSSKIAGIVPTPLQKAFQETARNWFEECRARVHGDIKPGSYQYRDKDDLLEIKAALIGSANTMTSEATAEEFCAAVVRAGFQAPARLFPEIEQIKRGEYAVWKIPLSPL